MPRLLIMGPPGAGKGTQSQGIANRYGVPAISTGDIFRRHVREQTILGQQVEQLLAAGKFVPDKITVKMVAQRLAEQDAQAGFLLDGFPRTVGQVDSLDAILQARGETLDAVVQLDVDVDVLAPRLHKRAEIEGRADDDEETIRHRLDTYTKETEPLLTIYRERGLLLTVDGEASVEAVAKAIYDGLDAKVSS
ncbi:6-phosphogluconolactonase [Platysternon megacephalum]|uniref:6-phosphogluconolactonase n=1 Tax=Platysternon megacephalum TaxID=55544 RepID=A0A4D9DEF1_9SAUR|nr:6-phosphogluconolactonase [Platysternon megacephalum]